MLQTVIQFVVVHQVELWATVTTAMVLGEKIAKMTKTTKDDEVVSKVKLVLNKIGNILALNVVTPTK